MRRFPFVTVMVFLVGLVLTGSLWTMHRAGREALRQFKQAQSQRAQDTGSALLAYLDSFDRDTRLLATLAQGTRGQPIAPTVQDHVILTAFQALATVVPHYRTIGLFGPARPPILAVDPTEDQVNVPGLVAASAQLAAALSPGGGTAWRGPAALGAGGRWFYIYAAPLGDGEAVVVTADAAMMLELVSGVPSGHSLLVGDPRGAVWLGCEQRRRCRLLAPGTARLALAASRASGHPDEELTSASELVAVGLPTRAVIGTTAPVRSPLGNWSVAMIASAADINVRQRAFLWQLVLTSVGVAGAMLTVGLFLVRQHTQAAALAARVQAAEEMATLRERSDKILENVPVGILGLTRSGQPAMVNRFFHERIANSASGTGVASHDTLAVWASHLRSQLGRALATGRSQSVTDIEIDARNQAHQYDVRVVPLHRPADEIEALALVEDRSELHSLQRQLVRAEKLVTVGVLSAGIAHEIGTPLAVIRGRAEHCLERSIPAAVAEDLRAIVAEIDRISSTIRQVLAFSRDDPGTDGRHASNAGAVVRAALQILEWRTQGKQVAVALHEASGLPSIAADPQPFEQVVVNLLMNACDASAAGGQIEVHLDRDPDRPCHLRLVVADHGVGIPPENLNAVFDPYFTTKKQGEGTGLGLAIVSHVVRSHRGEITLASTLGQGTTATVSWPLAEANADA